jgi:uncharacterized protein (DUF433 family)
MSRKHQKIEPEQKPVRIFGRIATAPDKFEGRPFILGRSVELAAVLDLLHQDKPDDEISRRFKLPKDDIDLCRAWQVRFEPETLSAKFTRLADPQNFFMLDENCTERILYDVARLFGRSTHVRAEGLTGGQNDDIGFVWAHALKNNYKAFLTADSDFRNIAHRHRQAMIDKYGSIENCPESVPVVIFYDNQDMPQRVVDLLELNQDEIRLFAEQRDAAFARLTRQGLEKCESDRSWAAQHPQHHP